ncbi:MAG: hypothetical protein DI531_08340 [Brevundimonas sp.]|uniref:hypothetical protein n=1 Tax=Brevundimonas sp. TaxID=1871086 RepID=UPI000DB6CF1E|nr:hypothetical protein [Brevundimonas sp.]PZU74169.1 MAG: hypothetical protein DI531_08340 [Brevundimonas sp.]
MQALTLIIGRLTLLATAGISFVLAAFGASRSIAGVAFPGAVTPLTPFIMLGESPLAPLDGLLTSVGLGLPTWVAAVLAPYLLIGLMFTAMTVNIGESMLGAKARVAAIQGAGAGRLKTMIDRSVMDEIVERKMSAVKLIGRGAVDDMKRLLVGLRDEICVRRIEAEGVVDIDAEARFLTGWLAETPRSDDEINVALSATAEQWAMPSLESSVEERRLYDRYEQEVLDFVSHYNREAAAMILLWPWRWLADIKLKIWRSTYTILAFGLTVMVLVGANTLFFFMQGEGG